MLIVIWQTFDGFLILDCIINKLDFPVITSLRFMLNLEKKYELWKLFFSNNSRRHSDASPCCCVAVPYEGVEGKAEWKIDLLDKHITNMKIVIIAMLNVLQVCAIP